MRNNPDDTFELGDLDLFADLGDLDLFAEDLTATKPTKEKPPISASTKTTSKPALHKAKETRIIKQIDYITAKGKPLQPWMVRPLAPLGDAFKEWLARAESDKGWYRKEHGFLFKDHDAAKRFADQLWLFQAKGFVQKPVKLVSVTKEAKATPQKPEDTARMEGVFEAFQGKARIDGTFEIPESDDPDLWTEKQRTEANLAAMRLAATKEPSEMTKADLAVLSRYSGWGGLSIKKNTGKFPEDFPQPEERGLIHEYYTPTKIVREVARVIRPLVPYLPKHGGKVITLEPSAGIGRFVQAARGKGFEALDWRVVEWSALSSRMLQAMRPDLRVYEGPFERWVRENEDKDGGRIGLLLSNPPYGARGGSVAEDPNRDYREKRAYAYFLRRGLDLLAPNGLGVFLIPSGFLTGKGAEGIALREKILKRHHLSAAYRLPSGIFPGALLVTDLLFFRARGLELDAVLEEDQFILEGRYFEGYPTHILGKEVGKDGGDDDQTKKPRWGYQVVGDFERLPDLNEREMPEGSSAEAPLEARPDTDELLAQSLEASDKKKSKKIAKNKTKATSGGARTLTTSTEGLEAAEAMAVQIGVRVDQYLAAASAQVNDLHVQLWPELHADLLMWVKVNGNPHAHKGVLALWSQGHTAIERFVSAYTKTGNLIEGLKKQPVWVSRFGGNADDVTAFAEWVFRANKELSLVDLARAWGNETNQSEGVAIAKILKQLPRLLSHGWCIDILGEGLPAMLYPEQEYLSGSLWPRYDRTKALLAKTDAERSWTFGLLGSVVSREILEAQGKKLIQAIKPVLFEDIEDVSPRYGWLPLVLITEWVNEVLQRGWRARGDLVLERHEGLVRLKEVEYEDLGDLKRSPTSTIADETISFIGWLNHDFANFKVSVKKSRNENLDEKRLEQAKAWTQSFVSWASVDEQRKENIAEAYNRHFRGYVAPDYGAEPLSIARWTKEGVKLHPHQIAGARRVLAHRGGMLAFDVGVGKTYTGIAVVARAKQEGWCKRPVILVPNSIAWKWYADIKRVLPDYRVAVIGSKRKLLVRGTKKGQVSSETDTPKERAAKWTRFQAGEYDVVLLTYTALARTRMNEKPLRDYADSVEAIRRQIALRQRNARQSGKVTERQEAVLKEGVAAWISEKMEIPESWEYDEGIAWDDIGVDLLVVDEAQNFKNLYMPEAREGGVPRFMGNAGEGSNRAWQLDFRCAAIRRHTGGTGIVLLSATPAKNSPLEFYNLLQLIDPKVWSRMGIYDPEQFIDRYLKIEMRQVIGTNMDIADRSAVVGFKNLDELREVIFRYADFKTAEDVGLKLPEPSVNVIEVEMDAAQDRKYDDYVTQIEEALESKDMADKAQILGLMAKMALVSIHARLDEGFDWKSAESADVQPESPKFKALAKRIKARTDCGHIVFCEPTAAHRWIVKTLVKHGIPEHRIAVLNAVVAKNTADRARIAIEFNGDEENEPKYDVVIANQVAYEGIDLQRRTCEIHHIDLPWEPATLQPTFRTEHLNPKK